MDSRPRRCRGEVGGPVAVSPTSGADTARRRSCWLETYPEIEITGSDYHAGSIEIARQRAEAAGVDDRVTFEVAGADRFGDGEYDLVCIFDALHDMGDPTSVARHIRSRLAPDGTWLLVEPRAGDRIEDNLNVVGRIFYSASTFICTPASRAQDGATCLGAQAGPARSARSPSGPASLDSARPSRARSTSCSRYGPEGFVSVVGLGAGEQSLPKGDVGFGVGEQHECLVADDVDREALERSLRADQLTVLDVIAPEVERTAEHAVADRSTVRSASPGGGSGSRTLAARRRPGRRRPARRRRRHTRCRTRRRPTRPATRMSGGADRTAVAEPARDQCRRLDRGLGQRQLVRLEPFGRSGDTDRGDRARPTRRGSERRPRSRRPPTRDD